MRVAAAIGPLLVCLVSVAASDVPIDTGIGHGAPWPGVPSKPALACHGRGQAVRMQIGFGSPGEDWINRIVPLRDGTVLAVGFLNRGATDDSHAFAVRLKPDGTVVWAREFGDRGANSLVLRTERPKWPKKPDGFVAQRQSPAATNAPQ
jgi:hypothetical protein